MKLHILSALGMALCAAWLGLGCAGGGESPDIPEAVFDELPAAEPEWVWAACNGGGSVSCSGTYQEEAGNDGCNYVECNGVRYRCPAQFYAWVQCYNGSFVSCSGCSSASTTGSYQSSPYTPAYAQCDGVRYDCPVITPPNCNGYPHGSTWSGTCMNSPGSWGYCDGGFSCDGKPCLSNSDCSETCNAPNWTCPSWNE